MVCLYYSLVVSDVFVIRLLFGDCATASFVRHPLRVARAVICRAKVFSESFTWAAAGIAAPIAKARHPADARLNPIVLMRTNTSLIVALSPKKAKAEVHIMTQCHDAPRDPLITGLTILKF